MKKNVGDIIRNRRIELGLSQLDLAKMAGISSSYLGSIEVTSRKPSEKTYKKLCVVLGMDEDGVPVVNDTRWDSHMERLVTLESLEKQVNGAINTLEHIRGALGVLINKERTSVYKM